MTQKDRQKLISAGFTVMRVDRFRNVIHFSAPGAFNWHGAKRFQTKASLNRELKQRSFDPKTIEE